MTSSIPASTMLRNAPGITVAIGRTGEIHFSNNLFESLPKNLDKPSSDSFACEQASQQLLIDACLKAIKSGESAAFDMSYCDSNGPKAHYRCNIAPCFDDSVVLSYAVANCIEITDQKKAIDQLKRSESLMTAAQRIAHLGTWNWQIHEPTVQWSDELYRIFAVSKESFVPSYEGYLARVHPDDRERVRNVMTRVSTEHISFSHDERIIRPDGQVRQLQTWGHAVLDKSGTLVRLIGVCLDITERKALEERVVQGERLRRLIVENVSDSLFCIGVETGSSFRFLSVNRSFLEITGLPLSRVEGKQVEEVIPPESLELVLDNYRRAILERKPQHWDETSRYPSGTKYVEATIIPLLDENGVCYSLIGTMRDVTERRESEKKAMVSFQILKAVVEGTTDAVYVKDLNGQYVMINACGARWAGKRTDEMLGKVDFELFPPETAKAFAESDQAVLQAGEALTSESTVKINGGVRTELSVKAPYHGADGKIAGTIGISRDITEIKQSKVSLDKAHSLLKATLDSTADGILVIDFEERITGFNKVFLDLWKIPKKSIESKGYRWALEFVLNQLIHPDKCLARLTDIQMNPELESFDLLEFKDGRFFERYSRPQRLGDKTVGRVFSYRDVTARVQAERRVRESEARLFSFLERMPIGITVFNAGNKLVFHNEVATKILEQSLEPELNRGEMQFEYHAFVSGSNTPYPQERLPLTRAFHGEVFANADDIELRIGSQPKNVQIWASPIFNAQGKIEYAVAAFQDISKGKLAQLESQANVSLLRATLEATADGILVVDTAGKIVTFNKRFTELWNLPDGIVTTRDDAKAIEWVSNQLKFPEEFVRRISTIYSNTDAETHDSLEFKSGAVLERHSRPQISGGKVIGRVWSFRDVTAQVRAEAALRESEARKAAILDSALDSIISMDHKGRILEFNSAAEKTFGYLRSSAVGRELSELIIPARMREAHRQGLKRYLESGAEHILGRRVELPAIRADGSEFSAELSLIRVSSPDAPVFTGFLRDVTERKNNEKMLMESSRRIRALFETSRSFAEARLNLSQIFDSIASSVSEYFQDGCVVRLFSEDSAQLKTVAFHHVDTDARYLLAPVLAQVHDFIDRKSTEEILRTGKPVLVAGSPDQMRSRLSPEHWPLLVRFPVHSWIIVPLRVANKVIGTVAAFRFRAAPGYSLDDNLWLQEVADRAALSISSAQLYLEAQRAIELREEFMAIASHELKTPLTPLRMQLQLLNHLLRKGIAIAGANGEELKAVIVDSDQQLIRLTRLVDDILDSTRLRTGKFTLTLVNCDIASLVAGVLKRMEQSLGPKSAGIRHHIEPVSHCMCDPARLEQVVINLLSNALKFGGEKPVEVKVSEKSGKVYVSVRDYGIGVAKADQTRIFERLERAVSFRQFGGLGMGLYIARQIVEQHGGHIWLKSEPGHGSDFIVELPVADASS
jgi:PAS domain S-box-containing protein